MVADVNTDLMKALEDLRAEMKALGQRLSALEAAAKPAAAPVAKAAPPPAKPAPAEPIPDEILLVISAAVAAFLGERAPIRQIRLVGSPGWALQGRVFIQASHNLSR